jgi:hypothetical protein
VNLKKKMKKMCNEMRGYATRSHVDGRAGEFVFDHLKLLGLW